jgi:hypothetical protein
LTVRHGKVGVLNLICACDGKFAFKVDYFGAIIQA